VLGLRRRSEINTRHRPRVTIVADEWRSSFQRSVISFSAPPLRCLGVGTAFWLPCAQQLLVPTLDIRRPILKAGDRLDTAAWQAGQLAYIDELDEESAWYTGSRAVGSSDIAEEARPSSRARDSTKCRACRQWWFLRGSGAGGAAAGAVWRVRRQLRVADQFTDVVRPRRAS